MAMRSLAASVRRLMNIWIFASLLLPSIGAADVTLNNKPNETVCGPSGPGLLTLTCVFAGTAGACPDRHKYDDVESSAAGGVCDTDTGAITVPNIVTVSCAPTILVNDDCSDKIDPQRRAFVKTDIISSLGNGGCLGGSDPSAGFSNDPGGSGYAPDCSPIIIDVDGAGFSLTSAENGVRFDMRGDGHPVQMAWTAPGSRNAFLALDRNHNGRIDDGTELFGNFTAQPRSPHPNGFLALAEFDKPENGGNGDGFIDEHDAVFAHLLLWIDENHDGIAQPSELHPLPELGVFSLSLRYREARRHDEFGNLFRYKAKVNRADNDKDDRSDVGPWAYDVFLVTK